MDRFLKFFVVVLHHRPLYRQTLSLMMSRSLLFLNFFHNWTSPSLVPVSALTTLGPSPINLPVNHWRNCNLSSKRVVEDRFQSSPWFTRFITSAPGLVGIFYDSRPCGLGYILLGLFSLTVWVHLTENPAFNRHVVSKDCYITGEQFDSVHQWPASFWRPIQTKAPIHTWGSFRIGYHQH